MVLGTSVDFRKASMQQRVPADDVPPQVRAMQLELANATQRERKLEGEVARLKAALTASKSEASEDFVKTLQGRIQDLQRELIQARQSEGSAAKLARSLEAAGADDVLAELAELRQFKAEHTRRAMSEETTQSLERQRFEVRLRELVESKTALETELAAARREISDLKAKGNKRR